MVEFIQVMCLTVLILFAGVAVKYLLVAAPLSKEVEDLRKEVKQLKSTINTQNDVINVIVKFLGYNK